MTTTLKMAKLDADVQFNLYKFTSTRVAADAMPQLIKLLNEFGFNVSTKSDFINVVYFLNDKTPLDAVMDMPDEQYANLFLESVNTMGPLLEENKGYNPDEWKDDPKPVKLSMRVFTAASLAEQTFQFINGLKTLGFRTESKEEVLQIIDLLLKAPSKQNNNAAVAKGRLETIDDTEFTALMHGDISILHSEPGQAPTPAPQQSLAVPQPQAPTLVKEVKPEQPPIQSPAPMQISDIGHPGRTPAPGMLSATPLMQFSNTKFSGPQKLKYKTEMASKFSELTSGAKKQIPGMEAGLYGDKLPILVKQKDDPKTPTEKPNTPINAGQYVADYSKAFRNEQGKLEMPEFMVVGVTPDKKLIAVSFPDGTGNDPGGQLKILDPERDPIRLSSHNPKINLEE